MRFLELHLKAFGTFSDRPPIRFPDVGGAGLCVLYGPNEAGKSTALRAIRSLLYGIPARSPDDFVHRYSELRIGARLRFDDGEELAVMRRKKNKDALYDYMDREVVRAERLERLVERVPESLFERFYGLDHRGLSDGSAALLQDDGEVGRTLFGAGLGVANLRTVLDGLEQEAAALFAPRASKPRINAAVATWRDVQKEVGQHALDPSEWARQEQVVREAEARLESIGRELEAARTEASRLERLKRSLPALARRDAAAARLAERTDVAPLPEDFAERLTSARTNRRLAEEGAHRARTRLDRERAARDALTLDPRLIGEREAIERLHQRVDGFEKAVEQLPRRESELARLDVDIEAMLGAGERLDAERLARLRDAVVRAGSTRALANEGLRLEERAAKAREEAAEARADQERLCAVEEEAAPGRGDPSSLRRALEQARKLGSLDDRIDEERRALESVWEEIGRAMGRLGLAAERTEQIEATRFPTHEWIDGLSRRLAEAIGRRVRARERAEGIRGERRQLEESLAKIRSLGAVPEPDDLDERRAERDRAWRALRRAVVEADDPAKPETRVTLADRFERLSAEADALGDRLRLDADRVAQQVSLTARASRLERDLEATRAQEEELEAEERAIRAEWQAGWRDTGVDPGMPEAMRDWRRGLDEALASIARRRVVRALVEQLEDQRRRAIAALREALEVEPESAGTRPRRLEDWIVEGEARLEAWSRAEEARRRREDARASVEDRVAKTALRVERVEVERADWRRAWNEVLGSLGMEVGARPEQALERLETMSRLLERQRERDQLADRVAKMRRDIEAFGQAVSVLVARCAPKLGEAPPPEAAMGLQRRLSAAIEQQALAAKIDEALAEGQEELEEAGVRAAASAAELEALCASARVADESGLDEALRDWREVEAARAALQRAEEELAHLAEGRPLAELEAAGAEADADTLAARLARLDEAITRFGEEQKAAIETLRSERDRLEAMDGSARVAELAESAESQLAAIRADVDRYVELRLAKQVLEAEIERYRSENQAPLLRRAGTLFAALTRGAYPRIASAEDEAGTGMHIVAVSAEGNEVPVHGLSAGTRDQLFLAIRLASLEESSQRSESMPLIADDVLIEFDDDRTRATLEVLAEIGRQSQILLFSHHLHVVEIARDLVPEAFVIEL